MNRLTDQKSRIEFGQKLKQAREKKEMSQTQVAGLVEIHSNYYARIERGDANPSLDILLKIAKALGIKSSSIITF
jgi:transcriptional regulator with XRE-family HTH domain